MLYNTLKNKRSCIFSMKLICGYFSMPSTCYRSFSTWYHAMRVNILFMTPALGIYTGTRYLHRYLVFTPILGKLHLIYELWLRHSVFTLTLGIYTGTWYIWHLLLTPGIWHAFMWYKHIDLTSWPLTGHYYPWYLYYMTFMISLLRGLGMTLYYYQIFGTPELLYSRILEPLK